MVSSFHETIETFRPFDVPQETPAPVGFNYCCDVAGRGPYLTHAAKLKWSFQLDVCVARFPPSPAGCF